MEMLRNMTSSVLKMAGTKKKSPAAASVMVSMRVVDADDRKDDATEMSSEDCIDFVNSEVEAEAETGGIGTNARTDSNEDDNSHTKSSSSRSSRSHCNVMDAPFSFLLNYKGKSKLENNSINDNSNSNFVEQKKRQQRMLLHEIQSAVAVYTKQERQIAETVSVHLERAAKYFENNNSFGAAISMRRAKRLQQEQFQLQGTIEYLRKQEIELSFLTFSTSEFHGANDTCAADEQVLDRILSEVSWKLATSKTMAVSC
mmetsp:Transcript_12558/g.16509  ORF Transcript_12558/g.16509 Transcript_12558/m.16509 type:complete len:257 (-) Transcript_12558:359-1129(-)